MPATATTPVAIQVRDTLAVRFSFNFNLGNPNRGFQLPNGLLTFSSGDSIEVDYSMLTPLDKILPARSIGVFIDWIAPYSYVPGPMYIITDADLITLQIHDVNGGFSGTLEKSSFIRPINMLSKRLTIAKESDAGPPVQMNGLGQIILYPYEQPSFTSW